jgi:hypothetical protein
MQRQVSWFLKRVLFGGCGVDHGWRVPLFHVDGKFSVCGWDEFMLGYNAFATSSSSSENMRIIGHG